MCVVSAIHDNLRRNVNPYKWTPYSWDDFKILIKKAEQVDKALGQADCDDPEKTKWPLEIQKQIDELNRRRSVDERKLSALKKLQEAIDDANEQYNEDIKDIESDTN